MQKYEFPGEPPGGRALWPHNIDTIHQKFLLLIVFTWFANDSSLNWMQANGGYSR